MIRQTGNTSNPAQTLNKLSFKQLQACLKKKEVFLMLGLPLRIAIIPYCRVLNDLVLKVSVSSGETDVSDCKDTNLLGTAVTTRLKI